MQRKGNVIRGLKYISYLYNINQSKCIDDANTCSLVLMLLIQIRIMRYVTRPSKIDVHKLLHQYVCDF